MARFFDELLKNRSLEAAPIPLWKLNVTTEEYEKLKNVVRESFDCYAEEQLGAEFALFYAESWRREYQGGSISKEEVARYAGIPKEKANAMYDIAKKALKSLHIPVIRRNHNLYFRTLLLQGGLPIRRIQNVNSGFNNYQTFLKRMIAELSHLSVNWDDVDVVKNLNCFNYLPQSLQDDNICAVSLQIVRAIIEERDELLPYNADSDELKNLTKVLKKERERVKKLVITHPLAIHWFFEYKKSENDLVGTFRYSLDSTKTIYSTMVSGLNAEECFQFDIFVSQQYVATYKKIKLNDDGTAIYKRVNADNKEFEWNGDSIIDVKIICDNDDELYPSIVNCCAPNLSVPQLYQKSGNRFIQQKGESSSECIVIYSDPWISTNLNSDQNITINNESYTLADVPDVSINNVILMENKETEETLDLKNLTSKYSVVYGSVYLDWLEKANFALLTKKVLVTIYDENGNQVPSKDILFREKGSQEWRKYSNSANIPPGIVEIKVVCPDESFDIKKFYFIGDLTFSVSNATSTTAQIQCNLNWGNICPVNQDSVQYKTLKENSHSILWVVARTPNALKCPTTCSFNLHKADNPTLKISIPSPYEGLSLIKGDDGYVLPDTTISFNEFSDYCILCSGNKSQYMEINYTGMSSLDQPVKIYQKIKNGITPLSHFEDSINRLFNVNGINSFDRKSAAILKIGDLSYKIRYFTLDSRAKPKKKAVQIRSIDSIIEWSDYKGNILACKLSNYDDEKDPVVIQLDFLGNELFAFPEYTEDGNYIVFSDVNDKQRVIPRLYHISNSSLSEDNLEERSDNKKRSIDEWIQQLSENDIRDQNSWGKVPLYIQIADKWKLPFRTFNAISASVSTPELMTKLLLRLVDENKIDELSSAILKIEQECAMAIHWNRCQIVSEQLEKATKDFPPNIYMLYSQCFMNSLKNLMTLSLDSDVADLMTRFLCGNLKNVDIDSLSITEINEYRQRAIGRNTDGHNFNSDLPISNLELKKDYYSDKIKMLPYQETLIKAPLYVYEYTQGWNDCLWESTKDQINRRRIINFYRMYYKYTYYSILVKMLK